MAYMNSATATSSTPFATLGAVLNALVTRYKNYRLYRLTLSGLSALSDRELSDLGLSRSGLQAVATDSVYK